MTFKYAETLYSMSTSAAAIHALAHRIKMTNSTEKEQNLNMVPALIW